MLIIGITMCNIKMNVCQICFCSCESYPAYLIGLFRICQGLSFRSGIFTLRQPCIHLKVITPIIHPVTPYVLAKGVGMWPVLTYTILCLECCLHTQSCVCHRYPDACTDLPKCSAVGILLAYIQTCNKFAFSEISANMHDLRHTKFWKRLNDMEHYKRNYKKLN
jgi:hypothetical protein